MNNERKTTYYVDERGTIVGLDLPPGLIPPPHLDLFQPLVGERRFLNAAAYRIPLEDQP